MAQWLRICLPVQRTQVQALVREDPSCRGATKPMRHNYWAGALEPVSHNYWAQVPQLLKPVCLEPVLRNKRSHHNEKPALSNKDPTQPKLNTWINKFIKKQQKTLFTKTGNRPDLAYRLVAQPWYRQRPSKDHDFQYRIRRSISSCQSIQKDFAKDIEHMSWEGLSKTDFS